MARSFNAASDRLTNAVAPVTNYPWTFAIWFQTTNATPGANQNLFNVLPGAGSASNNIGIGITNATGKPQGFVSNGGGTYDVFDVGSSALTINIWYAFVFVGVSATSRTGYLFQGGAQVAGSPVSSSVNIVNGGTAAVTQMGQFSAASGDFKGKSAEAAIWNVALTAGEALAYGQGALASTIRPASLKFYCPLYGNVSPEPDLSGNASNLTVNGTAAASGPPVMQLTPRWPITSFVAAAPDTFANYPELVMM
jgi:hypothetical protein